QNLQKTLLLEVPAGGAEFQVAPVELMRAATLRGRVVDDGGRAVAGATVQVSWMGPSHQFGSESHLNEKALTTDARGEWVLEGVEPKADVRLKARRQDAATAQVLIVRGDAGKP